MTKRFRSWARLSQRSARITLWWQHASHLPVAQRLSLLACTLALLGTSKPAGWVVTAAPVQPNVAKTDRVLEVRIDSSAQPNLHTAQDSYGAGNRDTPCFEHWVLGKTLTCVLPGDIPLESVTAGGACKGCDGNCAPPKNAFVRVKTRETTGWTETKTLQIDTPLPSHGKDWVVTRFLLSTQGASFIRAKFTVVPKAGGAALTKMEQLCRLDPSSKTAAMSHCMFLVQDDVAPTKIDVTASVEVTGWGLCKDDAPCAPPGTLRIESLQVQP